MLMNEKKTQIVYWVEYNFMASTNSLVNVGICNVANEVKSMIWKSA